MYVVEISSDYLSCHWSEQLFCLLYAYFTYPVRLETYLSDSPVCIVSVCIVYMMLSLHTPLFVWFGMSCVIRLTRSAYLSLPLMRAPSTAPSTPTQLLAYAYGLLYRAPPVY